MIRRLTRRLFQQYRSRTAAPSYGRRGCYAPESCRKLAQQMAPYSITSSRRPSHLRLKLLADEAVNRIGTAAADREEEAYCADQQHILVSPTARRITFRQMHE